MNDQEFKELLSGIADMGQHMRGGNVPGVRVREFPEPDVRAIREGTGLSQSRFASLIGVKLKTLQNWEQRRVRPTGPARVLLKIVQQNPETLSTIHG